MKMDNPLQLIPNQPPATPYEIRRKICRLEYEMFKGAADGTFKEMDFPLRHRFANGQYIRSIFLPAGITVVGMIHRHSHLSYITEGRVTVLTEGEGYRELKAYWEEIAPAFVKRAIYVHEDTVWTTVHPTTETDPEIIRKQTVAESYAELGLADPMAEIRLLEGQVTA